MGNGITTIQIRENVKRQLDRMKSKSNESYEDVIVELVREKEEKKRKMKELLVEGCKVMAEENLKITRQFEAMEDLRDWEW